MTPPQKHGHGQKIILSRDEEEFRSKSSKRARAAFDRLTDRHWVGLIAVLKRLEVPDPEDVAQEAFARAWKARRRYRGEASFFSFLCRIANRVSIDNWRNQQRSGVDRAVGGGWFSEGHELASPPSAGEGEVGEEPRSQSGSYHTVLVNAIRENLSEKEQEILGIIDKHGGLDGNKGWAAAAAKGWEEDAAETAETSGCKRNTLSVGFRRLLEKTAAELEKNHPLEASEYRKEAEERTKDHSPKGDDLVTPDEGYGDTSPDG
jgi:RNA polymerase sigma factor (sigma-70 family)